MRNHHIQPTVLAASTEGQNRSSRRLRHLGASLLLTLVAALAWFQPTFDAAGAGQDGLSSASSITQRADCVGDIIDIIIDIITGGSGTPPPPPPPNP